MNGSDAVRFQCPHCGKGLRAASDAAGKRVRCPKCSELAVVPFPLEAEDDATEPRPKAPAGTGRRAGPPRREEDEDTDRGARRSFLPWAVGGAAVLVAVVGVTIWLATGSKKPPEPTGPPAVAAAPSTPSNTNEPLPDAKPKEKKETDRSRELEEKLIGTWTFSAEGIAVVMGLDKAGKVTEFGFVVNDGTAYARMSNDKWQYKLVFRDKGTDLQIWSGGNETTPFRDFGIISVEGAVIELAWFDVRVNRFVEQRWKRISENPRYWAERDKDKKPKEQPEAKPKSGSPTTGPKEYDEQVAILLKKLWTSQGKGASSEKLYDSLRRACSVVKNQGGDLAIFPLDGKQPTVWGGGKDKPDQKLTAVLGKELTSLAFEKPIPDTALLESIGPPEKKIPGERLTITVGGVPQGQGRTPDHLSYSDGVVVFLVTEGQTRVMALDLARLNLGPPAEEKADLTPGRYQLDWRGEGVLMMYRGRDDEVEIFKKGDSLLLKIAGDKYFGGITSEIKVRGSLIEFTGEFCRDLNVRFVGRLRGKGASGTIAGAVEFNGDKRRFDWGTFALSPK